MEISSSLPAICVINENVNTKRLSNKRIAFTTPVVYAPRLQSILEAEGASAIWCPSITVQITPQTRENVRRYINPQISPFPFSGIAFTSRTGIQAVAEMLDGRNPTSIPEDFFIAALGRDADLVKELDIFGVRTTGSVAMVVPSTATPQSMVEELGDGYGKSILCPVPVVEGLQEPPVVPLFLDALACKGWKPVRLNAYATSWLGLECGLPVLPLEDLDALIFTSTAEVEGLLKSLRSLGIHEIKCGPEKKPVIAAHGPVTAAGASELDVHVDVVSKNSHSFVGIVDALDAHWRQESNVGAGHQARHTW